VDAITGAIGEAVTAAAGSAIIAAITVEGAATDVDRAVGVETAAEEITAADRHFI